MSTTLQKLFFPLAVAFLVTRFPGHAAERYVAPQGISSNDGSKGAPLDLQTALLNASPGDTVWIRGGEYRGRFTCHASGTPESPIVFRQYPGERVTIVGPKTQLGVITLDCDNDWFWGFEVYFDSTTRTTSQRGSFPTDIDRGPAFEGAPKGSNCKLINLVVHDDFNSFFGKQAENLEVYGSIFYYAGWDAPDRGHGHGVYIQNANHGTKVIADNILFDSFAEGLHAYSSGDFVQNLRIEGNVVFNSGFTSATTGYTTDIIVGGGRNAPKNIVLKENYTYHSPDSASKKSDGMALWLGGTAGCATTIVKGNYFVNETGTAIHIDGDCHPLMNGNTIVGRTIGIGPDDTSQNSYYKTKPEGVRVFVRPNQYEFGRANIIIYNWNKKSTVDVDVSAVLKPHDKYEVRDAQDFFGPPVLSGTFTGARLCIPMSGSAVSPIIGEAPVPPKHTSEEFGAFVLLKILP